MNGKEKHADRFVGITPEDHEEFEDRHRKTLEIFREHQFEKILDIGCGDVNFSTLLGEACNAKEIYGVELSEKGVEKARDNGIKAHQLNIDEEDLPFENNYFDAIFAGEIIEHLYDTQTTS